MSKGYYNKKIKGFVFDYVRKAKSISYGHLRLKSSVIGVALHWTEGSSDSCYNECDYFATGNTRSAGAHIFIDRNGKIGLSIPLKYPAWSVMSSGYASGAYDGILNNMNTVSIELCGQKEVYVNEKGQEIISTRAMSGSQELALYDVLKWIKKQCPNVKHFVRHYDIKKKPCPLYYVENVGDWKNLKKYVERLIFKGV